MATSKIKTEVKVNKKQGSGNYRQVETVGWPMTKNTDNTNFQGTEDDIKGNFLTCADGN